MQDGVTTINGRSIEYESGQTILEAAKANGISIPTLCYLDGAKAIGGCGVCVVEDMAGQGLVRACSTAIKAGMRIRTESKNAVQARREALTRLVSSGQHNCFITSLEPTAWTEYQNGVMTAASWHQALCPSWGRCELQNLVVRYGVDQSAIPVERTLEACPLDEEHPMFVRDYSRCIRCGRCIQACNDIQGNMAIPVPEGWDPENGTTNGNFPVVDYEHCVHCGECVQACPVGALFEKKAFGLEVGNEAKIVRTTCPYCGVGCQLHLHVKDDRIVRVTGATGAKPNQGRLCVKGRFGYDFIYSEERLRTPLIRENGHLREASWEEALDYTADRLQGIIAEHGPDSIAGVSCARSINEDSYQMQKLFRAVFKTNNIDHCART
jgi:NADP-reducing hydrogenase subunit HndD